MKKIQRAASQNLFKFNLPNSDNEEETGNNSSTELIRYRSDPTTANENMSGLQWWKIHESEYPELSQLARKFLATPATTVPCERLFSMAGHLINKRRSTLSPEHANELLCLQNWLK